MPRKTKKEKLLIELRKIKKSQTFQAKHIYQPQANTTISLAKNNKPPNITYEITSLTYIKSDLKKTLTLTILILFFELILYWFWR